VPETDPAMIAEALAAHFPGSEVHFRAGAVSGSRTMALAYIDARQVMHRLDTVLGMVNWRDEFTFLDGGQCLCRLSVRIAGEWITKEDVGGESDQKDDGDRRKAAVSDALKRAAVKFGIARYLYDLPQQWCDYDPQKKQLVGQPRLPTVVLPPKDRGPDEKPSITPRPMTQQEEEAYGRWQSYVTEEVVDLVTANQAYDKWNSIPVEKRQLRTKCFALLKEHARQLDFRIDNQHIMPDGGGIKAQFVHKSGR
jgi:hypothetical protein